MNDWGIYGRTYEKIAEHLAKLSGVGRVLCLLPPNKVELDEYAWPFEVNRVSRKLLVLTPNARLVPTAKAPYRLRQWFNSKGVNIVFKQTLELLGFKKHNTVIWVFPPHEYIYRLVEQVNYSFMVTQIVDNNTFRESDCNQTIDFVKKQYEYLASKADMVITSSAINYEIFSALNDKCYLFENAVDNRFIVTSSELPCRTAMKRPRLGYVGWITQRTDIKLLDYIARNRPDYDLIIAGPVEYGEDLNQYKTLELSNVDYQGILPYDAVPDFLRSIDICLMPHKDTLFSKSMSPLKLFQYLGSGRPIVTTPIAGLERWSNMVNVGITYEEFVKKIDEALIAETLEAASMRIEAVKEHTWEKRMAMIYDTVLQNMQATAG